MTDDSLIHDPNGGLPRLRRIMSRLRDPETGCPWDIEQNFATVAPYAIEEAYEVADAVEREAWDELKGELGDLLLQVVFHGQMADEAGHFTLDDVIRGICEKMVDRHPHVFGGKNSGKSSAQQMVDWENWKAGERAARSETGALDGVALALPALMRAVKLQNRAARAGFDWPDTSLVMDKVVEELNELRSASGPAHAEEEFGDVLFAMANLARHMNIDPEAALRAANDKFTRRFRAVETALAADGRRPEDSTLEEMDALWDAVKRSEKSAPDADDGRTPAAGSPPES